MSYGRTLHVLCRGVSRRRRLLYRTARKLSTVSFRFFQKISRFVKKPPVCGKFSLPGGGSVCPVHVCCGIREENLIAFSFTNYYNKIVILSL